MDGAPGLVKVTHAQAANGCWRWERRAAVSSPDGRSSFTNLKNHKLLWFRNDLFRPVSGALGELKHWVSLYCLSSGVTSQRVTFLHKYKIPGNIFHEQQRDIAELRTTVVMTKARGWTDRFAEEEDRASTHQSVKVCPPNCLVPTANLSELKFKELKMLQTGTRQLKTDGRGAPSSVHIDHDIPLTVITRGGQWGALLNLPALSCLEMSIFLVQNSFL